MVERAGFAFSGVGEPHGRSAAWAPVFSGDGPGAPFVIAELFVGLDARAALPGMLALTEDWRPDLIVRETCEFASAVAAEQFDVPLVDVGIHLDAGPTPARWARSPPSRAGRVRPARPAPRPAGADLRSGLARRGRRAALPPARACASASTTR